MQFNDFLKHKMALGRADATIQGIEYSLNCFWQFYRTKRKKLKTISKRDIEDYLYFLRQKNYKPGTIQDRMNGLRDFLRYKSIKTFPAFKISIPKTLPKFLNLEDIRRIRRGIKKERDLLIFDLLYASGMRTGELCSLNSGQINGNFTLLINGKGNKERFVWIPKDLYRKLKKFVSGKGSNEPVFLAKNKRISTSTVSILIKRYGEKARLNTKTSPHRLRHTFATTLLNNGMNLAALSGLLGHSSTSTTQIYAALSTRKIREEYSKYWGGKK